MDIKYKSSMELAREEDLHLSQKMKQKLQLWILTTIPALNTKHGTCDRHLV